MKKANKWKIMQITTASLGTIATTGIIGSVAYFFIYKNDEGIDTGPRYKSKPVLELLSNPDDDGNGRNIKIEMYKGNSYAENGPLDKKHLKILADRINGIRMFGPESSGLKEISINNRNIIEDDADGVYYLGSQQIGLNTKSIEDKIIKSIRNSVDPNYLWQNKTDFYEPEIQEIIVEFLYETFYHEYGHHIFTVYSSSPSIQRNNRKSISTKKSESNKIELDWYNKTFLNTFETIFKYNDEKSKKPKIENHINLGKGKDAKKYPTIASSFTLKELYDDSNLEDENEIISKNEYAFTSVDNAPLNPLLPPYVAIVNDETLKYLYSLSELLTRKMLLSSMPQNSTSISIANGTWIRSLYPYVNNFKTLKAARISNNTTSDLAKYDTPGIFPNKYGKKKILEINDDYIRNNYFKDDPFLGSSNENAMNFMNLIAKSTGQYQGFNLTYIKHLNNYRVQNKKFVGDAKKEDLDKIIFGGYFNKNNNYKYVGYKKSITSDDSSINKISEVEVNRGFKNEEIGFTYKDKLFSDRKNRYSTNDNLAYWVTKQYTDARIYENKPLYFYNKDKDGKIIDVVPLKSFRGQIIDKSNLTEAERKIALENEKIADLASSYLEEDPYVRKYKNTKSWIAKGKNLDVNNNFVMIGGVNNEQE